MIALALTAGAQPATAQSKKAAPKVEACQYLATSDVSKAIGKPIAATTELPLGSMMGGCSYYVDAAKAQPMLSTQVHVSRGPFYYSLYCETNKGDVKPGEPIAGLGDQACLREKSTLFVRKGDKLIMISATKMLDGRDPFIALARIALTKM